MNKDGGEIMEPLTWPLLSKALENGEYSPT